MGMALFALDCKPDLTLLLSQFLGFAGDGFD
jgi:hypothetical protein